MKKEQQKKRKARRASTKIEWSGYAKPYDPPPPDRKQKKDYGGTMSSREATGAWVDGKLRKRGRPIKDRPTESPLAPPVEITEESTYTDILRAREQKAQSELIIDLSPEEVVAELSRVALTSRSEYSKLHALDSLARCKGMFTDKKEIRIKEPLVLMDEEGRKLLTLGFDDGNQAPQIPKDGDI